MFVSLYPDCQLISLTADKVGGLPEQVVFSLITNTPWQWFSTAIRRYHTLCAIIYCEKAKQQPYK
jgi:hypothetical protein